MTRSCPGKHTITLAVVAAVSLGLLSGCGALGQLDSSWAQRLQQRSALEDEWPLDEQQKTRREAEVVGVFIHKTVAQELL